MKKFLKVLLGVILGILLLAVGYVAYVLIAYHRLPDELKLDVDRNGQAGAAVVTGQPYKILSYNIGFGAYESDYDFFMDGGTQSWAKSKEALDLNLKAIAKLVREEQADFTILQEVDTNATRTYHVDERPYFTEGMADMEYTFAENWDSPFLMYPILQPHGATKAGIMTFSKAPIKSAVRYSLPVETTLYKLLDLDRCFSVQRIPMANGSEFVLINMHLSAYTSDGKISDEQAKILVDFMQAEYEQGHYVVAGGDFNKDLTGDATNDFGTLPVQDYSWAKPFPVKTLENRNVTLVAPYDPAAKVASCRNPDAAWPGDNAKQFVITVDGFLVTDNVQVIESEVVNTGYAYSDHNPVRMTFLLEE